MALGNTLCHPEKLSCSRGGPFSRAHEGHHATLVGATNNGGRLWFKVVCLCRVDPRLAQRPSSPCLRRQSHACGHPGFVSPPLNRIIFSRRL
eukprot:scaffold101816_cov29-Tisochrysis_lutea.AAC.3